jgi:hypothetical protein
VKKLTKAQKLAALKELYGGIMASLLDSLGDRPHDVRIKAYAISKKWDAVSPHHELNPITIIELERALQ